MLSHLISKLVINRRANRMYKQFFIYSERHNISLRLTFFLKHV